jgi:hypothetical protein
MKDLRAGKRVLQVEKTRVLLKTGHLHVSERDSTIA